MNKFQEKILKDLNSLASEMNVEVTKLSHHPDGAYVMGQVSDYSFWIYDSGDANFSSNWFDRRFEIFDYNSEDELSAAFITSLKDAIERKEYLKLHPDKDLPPLLNRFLDWARSLWKNSNHGKN